MCQQKGKDHIRFISKVAEHIWAENDFKIKWEICLNEAFRRHRERIIKIDDQLRKTDPYYDRNKARAVKEILKDTVKIPIPPRVSIPARAIPAPIQMSALND